MPGAVPVALVLVSGAEWSLLYAFSIVATELPYKLLFEQLALPGRVLVPVGWLIFAVEFVRRERWIRSPWTVALLIVPVVSLFLGWTTGIHGLFWREVTLDTLWHAVPSFPTLSEIWLRLLETYGC